MDRLETKTPMIRILLEDAICTTGLTLNLRRQLGKHFPKLLSGM
jgi:hypothetical protein